MTDRPRHMDAPDEPMGAPSDIAAERACLGAMLINRDAIDIVANIIAAPQFYRPAHEIIFTAITNLHFDGEAADAVTVSDELARMGPDAVRKAGGAAYLHDLIAAVPLASNADYYAQIVAEKASQRKLAEVGARIAQLGYANGDAEVADLWQAAQAELEAGARWAVADDDSPAIDNKASVYQALEDLSASPGIPTPWAALTDTIAGWKPGCLYLIGARPAVGKSVAGNTIALDVARRGHAALLYSLEMSRSELYHRMLSSVGTVNMGRIQHRKLAPSDWEHLNAAAQHIAGLPIHVDDRATLSIPQIRASVKAEQKRRNVGIVIIDYVQLLAPPEGTPGQDRRVQVDAISRNLKALAKDCDVPVVALAQLNRGPEGRADKTPVLSDLREAGGLEQDADVVLLMHRDIAGRDSPATELKLVVGKNRHGPVSALELLFTGEHSRIEEVPWSPHSMLTKDA